ncbi:hypothetical protein BSZ35_19185 [Salinibacter sp. 10B]|nr:hypothetical protein BSZ35_19185 [Salinibacter sp. 10B]
MCEANSFSDTIASAKGNTSVRHDPTGIQYQLGVVVKTASMFMSHSVSTDFKSFKKEYQETMSR